MLRAPRPIAVTATAPPLPNSDPMCAAQGGIRDFCFDGPDPVVIEKSRARPVGVRVGCQDAQADGLPGDLGGRSGAGNRLRAAARALDSSRMPVRTQSV